jgi:hypothetical protein
MNKLRFQLLIVFIGLISHNIFAMNADKSGMMTNKSGMITNNEVTTSNEVQQNSSHNGMAIYDASLQSASCSSNSSDITANTNSQVAQPQFPHFYVLFPSYTIVNKPLQKGRQIFFGPLLDAKNTDLVQFLRSKFGDAESSFNKLSVPERKKFIIDHFKIYNLWDEIHAGISDLTFEKVIQLDQTLQYSMMMQQLAMPMRSTISPMQMMQLQPVVSVANQNQQSQANGQAQTQSNYGPVLSAIKQNKVKSKNSKPYNKPTQLKPSTPTQQKEKCQSCSKEISVSHMNRHRNSCKELANEASLILAALKSN